MSHPEINKSELAAYSDFMRKVRKALRAEKIKGVRCVLKKAKGKKPEFVWSGHPDDVFLAWQVVCKHIPVHHKLPSQQG